MQHLHQKAASGSAFKINHIALLSALFFMQQAFAMEEVSVLQSGIDLLHGSKYPEAYEIFKNILQTTMESTRERTIAARYLAFLVKQGVGEGKDTSKIDFYVNAYRLVARKTLSKNFLSNAARKCTIEDGISYLNDQDYIRAIVCFEIIVHRGQKATKRVADNTATNLRNLLEAYENLSNMCSKGLGLPRDEALLQHYSGEILRFRELLLNQTHATETSNEPLVKSGDVEAIREVTIPFAPPAEDPAIAAQQKDQFLRDYEDFMQHTLLERPYFQSLQDKKEDTNSAQREQAIAQKATILAFRFACFDAATRNSLVEVCPAFTQFNHELDNVSTFPEATPTVTMVLAHDITDITALIIPAAFDLIHLLRKDMKRQKIGNNTVFKFVEYMSLFDASQKATVEKAEDKGKNSGDESDEENDTHYMEPPALVGAALELLHKAHRGTAPAEAVPIDLESVKKEFREYAVLSIPKDSMEKQEQKERKARCRILRDYLLIQYYRLGLDSRKALRSSLKSFNRDEISIKALGRRNRALRDFLRRIDRLSRGKNVDLILLGMDALFLETNDARCLSALLTFLHEKIMAYQSNLAQANNNVPKNPNQAANNNHFIDQWVQSHKIPLSVLVAGIGLTTVCYVLLKPSHKPNSKNAAQTSSGKKDSKKTERVAEIRERVRQQQERLKHDKTLAIRAVLGNPKSQIPSSASQEKSPQPAQPIEKTPSPDSSQQNNETIDENSQLQEQTRVTPFRNQRTIEERRKAIEDAARDYAEKEGK